MIDGLLQELEQEAQTTRRVLARVPDAHLGWKPHPKARTLGELAMHVAVNPAGVAAFVAAPSPVQVPNFQDPPLRTAAELIPTLDASLVEARAILGGMDDATLLDTWRLVQGDTELMALPRVAMLRTILLNHWYHHRGQLSMYLRALDVPLPSIYGPSADESPFA